MRRRAYTILTANAKRQRAGWGRKKGPSGMMVIPNATQKKRAARRPICIVLHHFSSFLFNEDLLTSSTVVLCVVLDRSFDSSNVDKASNQEKQDREGVCPPKERIYSIVWIHSLFLLGPKEFHISGCGYFINKLFYQLWAVRKWHIEFDFSCWSSTSLLKINF